MSTFSLLWYVAQNTAVLSFFICTYNFIGNINNNKSDYFPKGKVQGGTEKAHARHSFYITLLGKKQTIKTVVEVKLDQRIARKA